MATLVQRPLRGSRISSFYPIKSLPSLGSLDSAFQLQEYISLLIRLDVHDVYAIVSLPGKNAGAGDKETAPEGTSATRDVDNEDSGERARGEVTVDEACWIYEQLRRLAQDLSHPLITTLQQECTRQTCPEMKAGEWLYLCVAHGNEGTMEQCCAIDYVLHTLDSATALLNSPRAFPSRLQIPPTSNRHFASLARRLGRIFAHAYFHHREAFEQAEAESSLYARFLALTSRFNLVPAEFLVIPSPTEHNVSEEYREEGEVDDGPFAPRLHTTALDSYSVYERRTSEGETQQAHMSGQSAKRSTMATGHGLGLGVPPDSATVGDAYEGVRGYGDIGRYESPFARAGSGGESSRKVGRSRTDTMVHHDFAGIGGGEEFVTQASSRVLMGKEKIMDKSAKMDESQESTSPPPAQRDSHVPATILLESRESLLEENLGGEGEKREHDTEIQDSDKLRAKAIDGNIPEFLEPDVDAPPADTRASFDLDTSSIFSGGVAKSSDEEAGNGGKRDLTDDLAKDSPILDSNFAHGPAIKSISILDSAIHDTSASSPNVHQPPEPNQHQMDSPYTADELAALSVAVSTPLPSSDMPQTLLDSEDDLSPSATEADMDDDAVF